MIPTQLTTKQKLVFKDVVRGGTISGSMLKHGYSPNTAKKTDRLTRTKGWKYLMDKYIGDDKLAKVHSEGLEATKYESRLSGKGESELMEVPDYGVRHRYLESGYKIKGRYNNEGTTNNVLVINVTGETSKRYETLPGTSTGSV